MDFLLYFKLLIILSNLILKFKNNTILVNLLLYLNYSLKL